MQEEKLIRKIEKLNCIKPDSNWVLSVEQKIMAQEPAEITTVRFDWSFITRPAFSAAFSAFAIISIVFSTSLTLAQNALPGDMLYSLKKASETAKMAFVPASERPMAQLELTKTKLNELSRVTQEEKNQGQKLAASIAETQKTLQDASKTLNQLSPQEKEQVANQVVGQLEAIRSQKTAIEQNIKTDILSDVQKSELAQSAVEYYKLYLAKEIETLEKSSLTESQAILLLEAKTALADGEVERAMDIVVKEIPAKKDQPKVEEKENTTTTNTTTTEQGTTTESTTSSEQ